MAKKKTYITVCGNLAIQRWYTTTITAIGILKNRMRNTNLLIARCKLNAFLGKGDNGLQEMLIDLKAAIKHRMNTILNK